MDGYQDYQDFQNPGSDLYNGYLFNRQRAMAQTYGTFPAQPTNTQALSNRQQVQPPNYIPRNSGQFIFVPSGYQPPGSPLDIDEPSTSGVVVDSTRDESALTKTSNKTAKRWDDTEIKLLIEAYKENHERLTTTKSSRGKKSAWATIYEEFIQLCTDSNVKTSKTLVQAKEKWRTLFEKYKSVSDNNKRTGRGKIEFEYFDAIDEFMGHSDKVNPKFVKEAGMEKADSDDHDANSTGKSDNSEQRDNEKTPKRGENDGERPKKKRRTKEGKAKEESDRLIDLLQQQQEALERSEENDRKALETLVKLQNDAERRHQEFMVAVLGKLGDAFSKK